jgi:hypothetical protein
MITITKNKKLSFGELKKPYNLVVACRDAAKGNDYGVCRTEQDESNVLLMGEAKLTGALAALDPAKSLAVKLRYQDVTAVAVGERAEEFYRMILGESSFPGNEDFSEEIDNQSLEKKINDKGTQFDNQAENKVAAGGSVTSNFPIASLESVSARSTSGSLTVVSVPDLNLGEVNLNDGGSPVADGVAVELVYQTKEQLVVRLLDQNKKVLACMLSKEFYDYLVANAV